GGNWLPQSATWGHNTMNDQTGHGLPPRDATDVVPHRPNSPLRTLFSWCGKHSKWAGDGTNIGGPSYLRDGRLGASQFVGTVVLYADDPNNMGTDSPNQPSSTEHYGSDDPHTYNNSQFNEAKMSSEYTSVMNAGYPDPIHADGVDQDNADLYGGTPGGYSQTHTFGPYSLAPGDSARIVIAEGVAGINRDSVYTIGEKWLDWDGGGSGPYELPNGSTTSDGDIYKNTWVFTGVDSLFKTFKRAKDNYDIYFSQGLSIPEPPPPPSQFSVNSGGDRIVLSWAKNAESAPGFAGYNIYRAKFVPDTTYELIKTINGSGTNLYPDLTPQRGFDYYYYITAFNDGSTNDVNPGVPLESGKFYTMTSEPAFLKRPAGKKLADIKIVPNPYNIRARELQFGKDGSGEDRIMFYNIPKVCRIKIFTERGDLVNTIEHFDGSGDEEWKQLTSSRQVVVSGLYIAHIEVLEDQYDDNGVLVLKKGDSIIKKFVIIR
ncbi:MAG: fibronectin, partial [Bacteroidota bacterium]